MEKRNSCCWSQHGLDKALMMMAMMSSQYDPIEEKRVNHSILFAAEVSGKKCLSLQEIWRNLNCTQTRKNSLPMYTCLCRRCSFFFPVMACLWENAKPQIRKSKYFQMNPLVCSLVLEESEIGFYCWLWAFFNKSLTKMTLTV